jgi:hypothetical protein
MEAWFLTGPTPPQGGIDSHACWENGTGRKWTGFVHQVEWRPLDQASGFLKIKAQAVAQERLYSHRRHVIPQNQGIAGLLRACFGTETIFSWPEDQIQLDPRRQWIQAEESDLDFLQRILATYGLRPGWFGEPNCKWGTLWKILPQGSEWPELRIVKPSVATWHVQKNGHPVFRFTTGESGLQAGRKIIIHDFPDQRWVISKIQHSLDLTGSILGHGNVRPYQAIIDLELIDNLTHPQLKSPPRGIFLGTIASLQNASAEMSPFHPDGSYPFRFDFEPQSAPVWGNVKMIQAFSSPHGGVFWPLLPGTRVMVGFESDDPDQPIILGALPATLPETFASNTSPARSFLRSEDGAHIWLQDHGCDASSIVVETGKGIRIHLDDQADRLQIQCGTISLSLNNAKGTAQLGLQDGPTVQFEETSQGIRFAIPKGPTLELQGNPPRIRVSLDQDKAQLELDESGTILLEANRITLKAKESLEFFCAGKVCLQADGDFIAKANLIHLN